jgi:hypothetical protein
MTGSILPSFPKLAINSSTRFLIKGVHEPVAQTSRPAFLVTGTHRDGFTSRRFLPETVKPCALLEAQRRLLFTFDGPQPFGQPLRC